MASGGNRQTSIPSKLSEHDSGLYKTPTLAPKPLPDRSLRLAYKHTIMAGMTGKVMRNAAMCTSGTPILLGKGTGQTYPAHLTNIHTLGSRTLNPHLRGKKTACLTEDSTSIDPGNPWTTLQRVLRSSSRCGMAHVFTGLGNLKAAIVHGKLP
jgi:hypothetical protein